jgi:serine-type D-Ala-D-Ala carboxypeptidase/endopeptidase (penicillin-binding protein 4)
MKKLLSIITGCLLLVNCSFSQTINQKLQKAFLQFETDPQLKHAISSLYVINAKTGKVVFDKNSQVGLAPASTQKIITAATAFELLGKDYRYKTELGYEGKIKNRTLNGSLVVIGQGDPTLGSWRWDRTKPEVLLSSFVKAVKNSQIDSVRDAYDLGILHFDDQIVPDYWIWQDVGNYYGAGFSAINWKENQFDIFLKSGYDIGALVDVISDSNSFNSFAVISEARAAAKGTGDNAYAYLPVGNRNQVVVRGTIPVNESKFRISAAIPDPPNEFFKAFQTSLGEEKIKFGLKERNYSVVVSGDLIRKMPDVVFFYTHNSPSLDSIIYWFLQKSINLYGEALIKTFAYEKQGFGSTDSGVVIVKKFWKEKGIDEDELNILDGSGLSPLNRITTHAQVEILKYAKTRDWFPYFYNALPEYNGMKMKSGTIKDVKAYCGYQKASDGNEYIFSFLVNNYNGPSSGVVGKMYKVLDILK